MANITKNDWQLSDVSKDHFNDMAKKTGVTLEQYLIIWFNGLTTGITHKDLLFNYLFDDKYL